jgi:hypothetical protein
MLSYIAVGLHPRRPACPLALIDLRSDWHFGATRPPEVGRVFWATLTELQRQYGCDWRRVLGHDLAPNGSTSGASERRGMESGACNCALQGIGPIGAP